MFWDAETWQQPTWNLFYPSIARAVLQYRVDRAPAANANARKTYSALHGRGSSHVLHTGLGDACVRIW